jgi:hypothetical protein
LTGSTWTVVLQLGSSASFGGRVLRRSSASAMDLAGSATARASVRFSRVPRPLGY